MRKKTGDSHAPLCAQRGQSRNQRNFTEGNEANEEKEKIAKNAQFSWIALRRHRDSI
jgi:hypothetical protein